MGERDIVESAGGKAGRVKITWDLRDHGRDLDCQSREIAREL